MRHNHFLALVQNKPLPPFGGHGVRAALAIDDEVAPEEAALTIMPPTPAAIDESGFDAALVGLVATAPGMEIPPVIRDDGLRVYFDNFTHGSGRRRAFCSCRYPGHGRCDKYMFLDAFEGPLHIAAWLFAWETLASTSLGHEDHLGLEPTGALVKRYLDELVAT